MTTTETAHAAFSWCLSGDHRACRKTFNHEIQLILTDQTVTF